MKKILILTGIALLLGCGLLQAQPTGKEARAARKAAEEQQQMQAFHEAVEALERQSFVLEAEKIYFKRGHTAYISPMVNFISLEEGKATVQISFSGPYAGPNGMGGITVEGNASRIKMDTNSRGNVSFEMTVTGAYISAKVRITLPKGSNNATAVVTPNLNSNRLTLSGALYPTENGRTVKGRTL